MRFDKINLLPPEVIAGRKAKIKQAFFGLLGVVIIVCLGVVYMAIDVQVKAEQAKLKRMETEVGQLKSTIEAYKVFQEEEAALSAQEQLVSSIKTREIRWSEVLDEVSLIIPEDCQLDSLVGDGVAAPAKVTLSGRSKTFEGVASFIVRLQNDKRFQNVVLDQTGLSVGTSGKAITFGITMQLAPDPAAAPPAPTGG